MEADATLSNALEGEEGGASGTETAAMAVQAAAETV